MRLTGRTVAARIWRATIQPVFNAIFNAWHYARIIVQGRYKTARSKRDYQPFRISKGALPSMLYKYDGLTKSGTSVLGRFPCWTASRLVFADMMLCGNCMDSAHFFTGAMPGKIRIWIPDGPRWYARVHYVFQAEDGHIYALEKRGLAEYASLDACRQGGRWL